MIILPPRNPEPSPVPIIGLDIGGINLKSVSVTSAGEIVDKASVTAGGRAPVDAARHIEIDQGAPTGRGSDVSRTWAETRGDT
ncbi:MAG: hypothetical protein NUV72_07650 [Bauldia sp.]|nr:hypothetical protein [Bauldia sp.]